MVYKRVNGIQYNSNTKSTKNYRLEQQRYDWIKQKYNLTDVEYDTMLKAQEGKCAICREWMDSPNVDHCHKTGKVRGILCSRCNYGLGNFKDNTRILIEAISYLEKNYLADRGVQFTDDTNLRG